MTAKVLTDERCAKCGAGFPLYENPKRHGEFLCFECLDRAAPEFVSRYPGWRERENARQRKAQQARENFSHQGAEPQRGLFL